jgi:hypothetical protein
MTCKHTLAAMIVLPLLAILASATHAAEPEQMTSVRFDMLAVNHAFDITAVKTSRGTTVWAAGYLGDKAKTGMEVHKKLGRNWTEAWVEFVAGGDGLVQINFQGEWYSSNRPDDIRYIWMDDVRVVGAKIPNADLEEYTPEGKLVGWTYGNTEPKYYSRDGSIAKSGKSCVAIWLGNVLQQKIDVKKGGTYRVGAFFRVADPSKLPQPPVVKSEYAPVMYHQQIQVEFKSEQAAAKAALRITPLFNGCQWSMSSRWDDNNGGDILMRDCLAKHGQHGTYYLNAFYKGWSEATPKCDSTFGHDLLKTGDSVGAHSLTHPVLSYCNRNRIFEEVAGDRILWEAACDKPVISYAFSYCNYINPQDGLTVQADIHRVLERGGFINCANESTFDDVKSDITLSPILPGDGAEIDAAAESALDDPDYQAAHPNMTHSMHMYYDTPAKWAHFEAQLDKYGHRPDWWYCNNNQYGAYRFQLGLTKLLEPKREGTTLTLTIDRPVVIDVNDDQPLTFEVSGVARDEVVQAKCATADCKPADRKTDTYMFNLAQDRDQALPKKIGLAPPNYKNRATIGENDYDTDFPDLKGLLHFEDGQLKLALENHGKAALTNLRVTYRLPLAWKEGVLPRKLEDLAAGATAQDSLKPTLLHSDYKYNSGQSFFIAQLDFRLNGEQGRLHLACNALNPEADHSYPSDGFIILGPFNTDQVDREKFVADVTAGKVGTQDWVLSDETRMAWAKDDPLLPPMLDVELIPAGMWFGKPATHVLASVVKSETAQTVEFRMYKHPSMRIFLGGKNVTNDATIQIPAGENRLMIITEDGGNTFLRVLKPGTEERVTSIQFVRPEIKDAGKEPYRPVPAVPSDRRTLAGKWRAIIVTPLPPSASMKEAYKDPGISEKARKLVAADADASKWQEVDVPMDWDKYPGDWAKIDGEAVLQRIVEVPAEWAGKDLVISLGPVDDYDDTFFNGALIGRTDVKTPSAYQVPRKYKIPGKLVKAGKNTLSVRIFDDYASGGITGAPTEMFIALDK